jgi:hypothetical protein
MFAINTVGFYGAGALLRDLLGAVHIPWLPETGVAWRVIGAVSYATAWYYWSRRQLESKASASRPAI